MRPCLQQLTVAVYKAPSGTRCWSHRQFNLKIPFKYHVVPTTTSRFNCDGYPEPMVLFLCLKGFSKKVDILDSSTVVADGDVPEFKWTSQATFKILPRLGAALCPTLAG